MSDQEARQLPPLIISEKQQRLLEMCRKYKFVLASGPRLSTKTTGCEVAICDHAWNVQRANICVASVSQSAALDSGVWQELVEITIPQYMALPGMKMEWVKRPYVANVSKKPTLEISNKYGGIAKIQLDSLKHEKEAESRFKGKTYSMLYIPELSNFKERKTFDVWGECLRGRLWQEEDYLFLGDTNPADEGEQSWIWQVWWGLPQMSEEELLKEFGAEGKLLVALRNQMAVLEFELADNIFNTPERINEVIARYIHDEDLYNRYVKGLWVQASSDALFAQVFRESRHVVGEIETPVNKSPLLLVPEENNQELISGWDPGTSINSAAAIIEKWWRPMPNGKEVLVFKILDELVVIDSDHTIGDFTEAFVKKIRWWEEFCGREFMFKHWSDRSVFDVKEPVENRYYHQLINEASGGEIILNAAGRGPNSVRQRVDLFRRLLFEDRILINRDFCPYTIQMCKSLRRGGSEVATIQKGARLKHIFDAIMYAIASEAANELDQSTLENYMRKNRPQATGVVSIAA